MTWGSPGRRGGRVLQPVHRAGSSAPVRDDQPRRRRPPGRHRRAEGKRAGADIELGVCGEHGGDPDSVHFFHEVGLDYVSCSPFRVPIARLEAGARRSPRRAPRAGRKGTCRVMTNAPRPAGWPNHPSGPGAVISSETGPACCTAPRCAAGRQDPGGQGDLGGFPADPRLTTRWNVPRSARARPGDRLRPGPGRRRLPGPRHRPQPVRAQRRGRPQRTGRRHRRLRGQCPDAAPADQARAQDRGRRPQPDPGHPGRHAQVPLVRRARHEVRRLRRGRRGLRLDQAGRARPPAVPGGPGHGLGRRRGLFGPRHGGRLPRRPHHVQEP